MQRWQEQGEQKLVELLRTMRSFAKMHSVWSQLAESQSSGRSGAAAYARQKAAMYERRRLEATKLIKEAGYGHLLEDSANVLSFVEEQRKKEAELIENALNSVRHEHSQPVTPVTDQEVAEFVHAVLHGNISCMAKTCVGETIGSLLLGWRLYNCLPQLPPQLRTRKLRVKGWLQGTRIRLIPYRHRTVRCRANLVDGTGT
ncbi:hypothetical protein FB451DRAFT_1173360 [Mycena latifolia]|nr:hypothetical protein FB451DRAFT_1173360 [Mycena latifolia]